ncbi:MAG: monovalent cation:proton antiporter-2 (CPA2) family protein [Ignavibacterium sp.]
MNIIKEIVIILLVSIPILFLFRKINLSSIIGFLIAGMIIGPFGFGLISETEEIEVMAEIGVILLMFTIGLEFSIEKLLKMKKLFFIGGSLQVGLTILIFSVLCFLFGLKLQKAIFISMLISLSSTAIVLRLFVDKNELDSPQGKISLGMLLFQDLFIVPALIMLPILGSSEKINIINVLGQIVYAICLIIIIVLVSRFIIPKIIYQIANIRVREVFTIGILLLILGTAYITELIGLSLSIGAFIAGLIISESEFSYETIAEILPFKDAFNSLFFVSIGLLLNLKFVSQNYIEIFAFILLIIFVKTIVIILVVYILKYPLRIGIITGLTLSQVGEFSFVLAQAGMNYNLLGIEQFNSFLAASIFTMILTPFLTNLAPIFANALNLPETRKDKSLETSDYSKLIDHVIIAGFGLNGKNLASVLKETGIDYVVVELNPDTVLRYKSMGEKIVYGDITKKELLMKLGIQNAKVIVFAISDPQSTKIALRNAKQLNPQIYSIIRTRYIYEVDDFKKLGADEVIPEEFETSLQIFNKVLLQYHIPLNIIMRQVNILRSESYKLLRSETNIHQTLLHIDEILAASLTETFYIDENNPFINHSLKEINLRAKTGATIIAIVRKDKTITNPSAEEKLQANDTLVITGNHKAVDDAVELLSGTIE